MIISVMSAKLVTPWFLRVSPLCASVMHTLSFLFLSSSFFRNKLCVDDFFFFGGVGVLQPI